MTLPWSSPGTSTKPIECYATCAYARVGSGFVPDYVPERPLIAVLLEAPGETEVLEREPLRGKSGKLWIKMLINKLGYRREDVLIANTLRCRPKLNGEKGARDNQYPTGNLRVKAERACRQWDHFHGDRGSTAPNGIAEFSPTVGIICFHPAAILRTTALYKLTLRSLELAFKLASDGERPVVLMGDVASELIAPWTRGQVKRWNRHYFPIDGWPKVEQKFEGERGLISI